MTDIFIAYIVLTIFGIAAVSLLDVPRRKRSVLSEKEIFDCPVCAYRYIISRLDEIHRCPQCNSLNKT